MIYVDELSFWPGVPDPFKNGYCHLTTDGPLEDLFVFARKLRLRRSWFQDSRVPHYDLTPHKRILALKAGAVFLSSKEQMRRRRENCSDERRN